MACVDVLYGCLLLIRRFWMCCSYKGKKLFYYWVFQTEKKEKLRNSCTVFQQCVKHWAENEEFHFLFHFEYVPIQVHTRTPNTSTSFQEIIFIFISFCFMAEINDISILFSLSIPLDLWSLHAYDIKFYIVI